VSDEHELEEDVAFVSNREANRGGRTMSGTDFVRSLGFDDIADAITGSRSAVDPSQRESAL